MYSIKLFVSQAKHINQYKNLRTKVVNCCANIYFNRQCIKQGIVPKYAHIKIPNTSPASKMTQKKVQITRMKSLCNKTIKMVVPDVPLLYFIITAINSNAAVCFSE